jgi:hypothetical protein
MKLTEFRLNIEEFSKIKMAVSLSITQMGILFEILNLCWSSNVTGHSDMTPEQIAKLLGCSEADVAATIGIMAPFGWLVEELEMTTFQIRVKSPMLEKQFAEYVEQVDAANKETRRAKKAREIEEKRLMDIVRKEKDPQLAPRVAYLDVDERTLGAYKGWMPTTRFTKCGEAFRVTEDFIKELKEEFPDVDVNAKILEAHDWLCRNPTKRKTLAQLPKFLSMWMTNSRNQIQNSAQNPGPEANTPQLSLDDELKKLMGTS